MAQSYVTQVSVDTVFNQLDRSFSRGLEASLEKRELMSRISRVIGSSTRGNVYDMLKPAPKMKEYLGAVVTDDTERMQYYVQNRKYYNSVEISLDDIEDDETGQNEMFAESMGREAGLLMPDLMFAAYMNGKAVNGIDGVPYFSATHPLGDKAGSTFSNLTTGGSAPFFLIDARSGILPPVFTQVRKQPMTYAMKDLASDYVRNHQMCLFQAWARGTVGYGLPHYAYRHEGGLSESNYNTAREAMISRVNPSNSTLGVWPTHLLVGVSDYQTARELFMAERLANGASNTRYSEVEVVLVKDWA